MSVVSLLDTELFENLAAEAQRRPRRRANHNLHATPQAACQRFFNALAVDSYVRPHCHHGVGKEETLLVVQGQVALLCFDAAGQLQQVSVLGGAAASIGAHIPCGQWHALVALQACVLFETKAGPYDAAEAAEFAPWAPPEHSAEAPAYLAWMRAQVEG